MADGSCPATNQRLWEGRNGAVPGSITSQESPRQLIRRCNTSECAKDGERPLIDQAVAGNSPVYGPGWEFPLVVAQGVAGKPGCKTSGRKPYFRYASQGCRWMTLYGYARVSVREPEDKNLDLQVERLVRAGCSMGNIRAEEASGAKDDRAAASSNCWTWWSRGTPWWSPNPLLGLPIRSVYGASWGVPLRVFLRSSYADNTSTASCSGVFITERWLCLTISQASPSRRGSGD